MAQYTEPATPTDSSLATSIFESPKERVSEADLKAARQANWRFSTLCANVDTNDQYGASSTPIYQTATFKGMDGSYDYTRSGNPTRGGLGESKRVHLSAWRTPAIDKCRGLASSPGNVTRAS